MYPPTATVQSGTKFCLQYSVQFENEGMSISFFDVLINLLGDTVLFANWMFTLAVIHWGKMFGR